MRIAQEETTPGRACYYQNAPTLGPLSVKGSTKIAQFVSDISNLGTEVGRTSFVVLDMFSSVVSFSKTMGWSL